MAKTAKTYKRPRTKKRGYKKTYRKGSSVTIPKNMVDLGKGFPKKITMTMKYFDNIDITSTTGSLGLHLFSCNGLYDPNYTGLGHQPMFFDQLTALYSRYQVIGSRITVKFLNSAANTGLIACGVFTDDDATVSPSSFMALSEQTQSSRPKFIAYNASSPVTVTSNWSARKYFASKQGIIGNSVLQGNSTANPAQQSYWCLYVQCTDLSSTVSVFAEVSIEYIAVWNELKDVAQS